MGLYELDGRIYDAVQLIFTFGIQERERIKQRALAKLDLQAGTRVLDWGCGTGMSLKPIQNQLSEGRIYAVERSASMLKRAVARAKNTDKLEFYFILGNGLNINLPEKVDVAVASYSLGVLEPEELEKGVEAIWRNMKSDGRVVIVDTEIPGAETLIARIYQPILKFVLLHVFEDKYSNRLMPTIKRFFEQIDVEQVPAMTAIAFLGKRRDVALPGA